MTPETAVRLRLLSTPAVTALIGTRMYPDELPRSATLPALVSMCVSDNDILTQDRRTGVEWPRLQIDAYALSRAAVDTLHAAVKAALHGKSWIAAEGGRVLLVEYVGGHHAPSVGIDPALGASVRRRISDYVVYFRKE